MTQKSTHIAIAGYGLLGRLIAWRLLLQGARISVFEAASVANSPAAGASAAGMIAPLSEAVVSEREIYNLGCFALATWPRWLQDMQTSDGGSLFHHCGSLLLAHPQDISELHQFERELRYILEDGAHYQRLDRSAIQALAPDINPLFDNALQLRDEAHIDNRHLLDALHKDIVALGGMVYEQTPVEVAPQTLTTGNGQTYRADWVIDCRGIGSKKQQPQLRGVRGETLHIYSKDVHLPCPVRLMHPRYQLYAVPKPEHQFVIGATQIESEDLSPVSLQSSLELSSALYTLAPGFAEARILKMDANLRPAFMDNKPQVKVAPGLITANGLFRHGYLLAPAVVDCVLGRINDENRQHDHYLLQQNNVSDGVFL
ncbi:MAG TPA: FAD-dependent oxidoreductase [Cellvibrionaceae bacterium]